jgi:putative transposase
VHQRPPFAAGGDEREIVRHHPVFSRTALPYRQIAYSAEVGLSLSEATLVLTQIDTTDIVAAALLCRRWFAPRGRWPFQGQQMVAALGIDEHGTENDLGHTARSDRERHGGRRVAGDLADRGLDFTDPRLYILDGGKALTAAVKKHAGESAAIQRCQVHKRRNVLDHLTDEQKPGVAKKLNAAYALEGYDGAKEALNALHRELIDLNPSAARSLGEGMEETLTVHRLHLPAQLRKTMASTNVIESAFSIVEKVCKNVKRWHGGDQRERWVGSGLLVAENQFRRITDYKLIPVLMEELKTLSPSKAAVVKRRKAS